MTIALREEFEKDLDWLAHAAERKVKVTLPQPYSAWIERGFHPPHEYGAWWTFLLCLLAGLGLGAHHGASLVNLAVLAIGCGSFFLASDWVSELSGRSLEMKPGIRPDWEAWQGWLLVAMGISSFAVLLWSLPATEIRAWVAALLVLALGMAAILFLRFFLLPRNPWLLALSSLMVSTPALLASALGQGSFSGKSFLFWAGFATYFPASIFYLRVWLQASALRRHYCVLALLPYLGMLMFSLAMGTWLLAAFLSLFCLRLCWRLLKRLNAKKTIKGGVWLVHMRLEPGVIRHFGWEQVGWSLVLTLAWTGYFLGR